MTTNTQSFELIEDQEALNEFGRKNRSVEWMCFDTEFVGEKRFVTRLCLIQVATPIGNYLIDPFPIKDMKPLLLLLEASSIVKVTHAGDNDYRLFYEQFKIVPQNVFDTQIAAGMVGYRYPVSLRNLVEGELQMRMKKGYTVADWETRPFNRRQLKYALNDIQPLYGLWQALRSKLLDRERLEWAREEFAQLEDEEFYIKDPNKEALDSRLINSLRTREQVFLIRLYAWRRQLAKEKNYSKEMVLPRKMISQIVRTIQSGRDALKNNRRIPDKIVRKYGALFEGLYQREITQDEQRLLKRINRQEPDDPKEDILIEMLYLLVKYQCLDQQISENLVLPRGLLKKLKSDTELVQELFGDGWRREFLGADFLTWLKHYDQLEVVISNQEIKLLLDKDD